MKTIFLGKNCIELEEVDSTNSYLADLISSPALLLKEKEGTAVFEGMVVVAKNQVQGRGQRGSSWQSESGKNLIISILLNPTFLAIDEQFRLNKAVSLGVTEFIQHPTPRSPQRGESQSPFSMRPIISPEGGDKREGVVSIKWPNDIYISNKKVAGILIENSVSSNKLQQSIVGIGINVNQEKFSANLPNPISLKLVTGKEFDLKDCLEQLCSCIEKRYLELRSGSTAKIDADYLKSLCRFGEMTNYKFKDEILKAKITGVSKIGKLLLETEKGEKVECDFKEIAFLT